MIFGLFKKKYPILTPENIEPVDAPISTAEAKRIFKAFMSQIGYLERGELAEHAGYLADDIKEMTEAYREDLADLKSQIPELKAEIKKLNQELTNCAGNEQKDIEKEINWTKEALDQLLMDIEDTKREQAEFKRDKRSFLIRYINDQTQDDDWE